MPLTRKQVKDYLANPSHCPFCRSENTEADRIHIGEWDDGSAYSDVKCLECGRDWRDIYRLVGVLTPEETVLYRGGEP